VLNNGYERDRFRSRKPPRNAPLNAPSSFTAAAGDIFREDPSVQVEPDLSMWQEMVAPLELFWLYSSPVFWGCGLPRGNGEAVVVIPGFLGSDSYLATLVCWLERMGYRAYYSGIDFNVDCPDATVRELLWTVERAVKETGGRARLVGHSLGGLLARAASYENTELIAGVVTLGSPIGEVVKVNPSMQNAIESVRMMAGSSVAPNLKPTCFSGHCTCGFTRTWMDTEGVPVPLYSIWSTWDGVVGTESCKVRSEDMNIEVSSSHTGMAWNPQAYRAIAESLAKISKIESYRHARPA
jgi:hypothetical protein